MADDANKKRKRHGEISDHRKKQVVLDAPAHTAAVSSILQPKSCPPIIVTTPGFEVPDSVPFHSYSRDPAIKAGKKRNIDCQEMLLYSKSHPSLDYTGREERLSCGGQSVKHFVGIFDPRTGKLDVIEGKKMVVRGVARSQQLPASSADEERAQRTMIERRTDLGQTFGTKKAKKALQDKVLNAISSQKNSAQAPSKIDNAGKAMLQSVGQLTADMATREELQLVVDEAKPVPKANLDAQDIQDVYDPKVMVGAEILNLVPIREWQEKVQHNEGITTSSRFIAGRVNAIANNPDALTRLRVLRYLGFVLSFFMGAGPGKERGTRRVPPRDKLREMLAPAPEAVVENIRRKFSDAGVMRSFHIDLLMTSCCVFACIVDNFEVDTQDLREDLRLDQQTMNKLFREIGGRVNPVSDKARGIKSKHIGKLTLPLVFPKQRLIKPRRR